MLTAMKKILSDLIIQSLRFPRYRVYNQQFNNISKIAGEMEQRANGKENNSPQKENISE